MDLDLLEGFSDDEDVGKTRAKEPRPLFFDILTVERAVLETDTSTLQTVRRCAEELWKEIPDEDGWKQLSQSVLQLAELFVRGAYGDILQKNPAKLLLAPFAPEDIIPLIKAACEEKSESLSMAESIKMVLEDMNLGTRLFGERVSQYFTNGRFDMDNYDSQNLTNDFVADQTLPDTYSKENLSERNSPDKLRFFEIALVAASCLQLYVQENWTGPELTQSQVNKFYPLDFCSDLWEEMNENKKDPQIPESDSEEDDKALIRSILKRRSPIDEAALKGLSIDALDMFEHVSYPVFLWTASCLFHSSFPTGLLKQFTSVQTTAAWFLSEGFAYEEQPITRAAYPNAQRDIAKAGNVLSSPLWWMGRTLRIHQRSLVDRKPSGNLYISALCCSQLTAQGICPPYADAFVAEDKFQKNLVEDIVELAHDVITSGDLTNKAQTDRSGTHVQDYRRRKLQSRFLLEWGIIQQSFYRQAAAKTSFFLSKKVSLLSTQLVGELGRRTKFQTHDISQLVLKAKSAFSRSEEGTDLNLTAGQSEHTTTMANPNSVSAKADSENALGIHELKLDEIDEENILYERVQLSQDSSKNFDSKGERIMPPWYNNEWGRQREISTENTANTNADKEHALDGPLTILDQGIILSLCLDIQNNNPKDGLVRDEMRAYVMRALDTPQDWMTHSMGLLIKSRLEFESYWTAERGMLQMQALVDQHTNRLTVTQSTQKCIDESAPANERLSHIYSIAFPSRWELKRDLADRYKKAGIIRSALVLYEELELWNEIIECHISIERLNRAKKLLSYRLSVHPTPRLWCLYGHVCDDDSHYLKAWEISGERYGPAMLALGKRYYNRDDFENARKALEQGLHVSKHSENEWYLLGVVCMCLEDFQGAINAFSHCVQLKPDHANAWANLGGTFLRLSKNAQGFNALAEAVKYAPTNWKMHQNYLKAAMLNRKWDVAIRTMHQLLELRWKDPHPKNTGIDVDALGVLVTEVCDDLERSNDTPTDTNVNTETAETHGQNVDVPVTQDREMEDKTIFPASANTDIDLDDNLSDEETEDTCNTELTSNLRETNRPRNYRESVAKLLGHITSSISKEPRVWSLYSRFNSVRGKHKDALECKKKQLRALQQAGWEHDLELRREVCNTATHLNKSLMADGSSSAVMSARMLTTNILSQIDRAQRTTTGEKPADEEKLVAQLRQQLRDLDETQEP